MKKIAILALCTSMLCTIACKSNNDPASAEKIDFTKSYENAALALTSAQDNYNTALASKDVQKINVARKDLQTATTNYINSKNSLVQHGGVIKQEYESKLSNSEKTLSVAPNTSANKDSVLGGKVGQSIEKNVQTLEKAKNSINNTTSNTLEKVDNATKSLAAKKAKAQQDFQNVKDQSEKRSKETKEKTKKLKDDITNLFK